MNGDNGAMPRSVTRIVGVALVVGVAVALPATAWAHGAVAPAPVLPGVLLAWRADPVVLVLLAAAAFAYLWAVRRVDREHPRNRHPRHRTWLFLGGLAVIGIALLSPIEAYEGQLFSVHMVQHMLLELLAAPLLLAGGAITLALRAARPRPRRWLLTALHSPVARVLAFPVVAWVLFAAVNWGWHFSALYDEALENPLLHHIQHATFLGAALLFWWPVLGADPAPWRLPHPVRLLYVFLAMPQNSFLGVALLQAGGVLYPHYLTNLRTWGPTPLADQQLGGMLMWSVGDVAFVGAMAVVVWLWVRHEERRTTVIDRQLAAERAARGEESWRPNPR
jgi:putative copper resistance protein D